MFDEVWAGDGSRQSQWSRIKFIDSGHFLSGWDGDARALAVVTGRSTIAAVIMAARRMRMGVPSLEDIR